MAGEAVKKRHYRWIRLRRRIKKKNDSKQGDLWRQIILLVVGFGLTGGVGTWLTNFWSQRAWSAQQEYLRDRQLLEQRYQVLNQIVAEVAATHVAASDIITMEVWDFSSATQVQEIQARENRWNDSSRRWRAQSRILLQKLAIHFGDPQAVETFQTVINKRRQLGQKIRALLELRRRWRVNNSEARQLAAESNELLNRMDELAIELGRILGRELR